MDAVAGGRSATALVCSHSTVPSGIRRADAGPVCAGGGAWDIRVIKVGLGAEQRKTPEP